MCTVSDPLYNGAGQRPGKTIAAKLTFGPRAGLGIPNLPVLAACARCLLRTNIYTHTCRQATRCSQRASEFDSAIAPLFVTFSPCRQSVPFLGGIQHMEAMTACWCSSFRLRQSAQQHAPSAQPLQRRRSRRQFAKKLWIHPLRRCDFARGGIAPAGVAWRCSFACRRDRSPERCLARRLACSDMSIPVLGATARCDCCVGEGPQVGPARRERRRQPGSRPSRPHHPLARLDAPRRPTPFRLRGDGTCTEIIDHPPSVWAGVQQGWRTGYGTSARRSGQFVEGGGDGGVG